MNPDGRWTAANPAAAQPHTTTASYQPQYPGDSTYLPQPDYAGHPAMRPTLPAPDRHRLRMLALLATAFFVLVIVIASLLVFHYATERPALVPHTASTSDSSKSKASSFAKAADTKRKHDLKLVQTSLEAYFTKIGHYPTQAQMDSSDWLKTNMPDASPTTLTGAKASDPSLSGRPLIPQYTYKTSDATGANCEAITNSCSLYTLSVPLSDGSAYTMHSLNS